MHPIRRHILYVLIINPEFSYSKLKPQNTESNLFIYHLKQLINEGLVEKINGKYSLTKEGKVFADSLSLKNLSSRIQPKIVTLLVCKNKKGEVLLYKRKRQPFANLIGFPYGKIHLGESVLEAGKRELQEKTGLSANLSHKADVYLTIFEGKNLLSQMLCHVLVGQTPKGNLISDSEIGQCFWEKGFKNTLLMPGVKDIYDLVQNPAKFIFKELTFELNN